MQTSYIIVYRYSFILSGDTSELSYIYAVYILRMIYICHGKG